MKLSLLGGKIKVFLGGLLLLVLLASIAWLLPAQAEDFFLIEQVPAVRDKNLVFSTLDGSVALSFKAGTSSQAINFKFLRLLDQDQVSSTYELNDLKSAGDLYLLELVPYIDVTYSSRPRVSIKFNSENKLKSLYYLNTDGQFVKLLASRDTKKNILSFEVPEMEKLIFGLFEEPVQQGTASWYVHPRYPKELMAASTDFSFGSKVKVTNLDNNKVVVVTIKDYGPDKSVHPDRVIDLGKEAFKKIASTRAGIINVKVESYLETVSTTSSIKATTIVIPK